MFLKVRFKLIIQKYLEALSKGLLLMAKSQSKCNHVKHSLSKQMVHKSWLIVLILKKWLYNFFLFMFIGIYILFYILDLFESINKINLIKN